MPQTSRHAAAPQSATHTASLIRAESIQIARFDAQIKEQPIYVNSIATAAMEHRAGKVNVAFMAKPFDLGEETRLEVPLRVEPGRPQFLSFVPTGAGIDFFDGDDSFTANRAGVHPVLDAFGGMKDRYGAPCRGVYFAALVQPNESPKQFMRTKGQVTHLANVASIRYDHRARMLFGIELDDNNVGRHLVSLRLERATSDSKAIFHTENWERFASVEEVGIVSLSKPNFVDDDGSGPSVEFAANLHNGLCRPLTIRRATGGTKAIWGDTFRPQFTVIGTPQTQANLLVGYKIGSRRDEIVLMVERISDKHPLARLKA